MKEMKRIISLLLCLVMLAGYLPVNARAEEAMTTEPSAVETAEETAAETTEETEPEKPGKPAGPKGPGKHEKPGKPEPVKPEAPKPEQETVPETTEATVPVTEETVPETTEATVPATEETVPETTEETEPVMMMAAPKAAIYQVPAQYAQQGYEAVDAAVIFTDLHTMYNGNSSEGEKGYKKTIITNMMTALKDTGLKFSSVTSGGDAFSENGTAYGKCYTDTITGYIQGVLGAIPVNYVWSDHDRTAQNNATEKKMVNKKSHLAFANENYYVYALSMGDICSFDRYDADFNDKDRAAAGFTATIDDAIAGFKAEVAKMDKTRPLLIVSHLPLFDARNDNAFAEKWYNAISEAAKEMDVFFYYGHNHNHDTGNDYYYGKGSTMNVATTGGWTDYQTGIGNNYFNDLTPAPKTNINFTHLCGGYMEPSSTGNQSSKTRQGTVLVTVLLQDAEGNEAVHLVTYGSNGEYTGNYALNTVVESIYEKSVTTPDQGGNEGGNQGGNSGETTEVKKDEATGITVAAPGVTGVSVEVKTPASVPAGYTAYASYDINLEGYTQGDAATVTVPAPAGFNADRPVVVLHDGEQIATTDIVDGKITFTTNHFSTYDVAQVADAGDAALDPSKWVQVVAPSGGNTTYTYTQATSITGGQKYVIVANNNAVALMDNNGKMDSHDVTISDNTMTSRNTALTEWTFSGATQGTISNGTHALHYNKNSFSLGTESTVYITENGSNFKLSGSSNPKRGYSLYYTGSGWSTSDRNSTQYVRLYQFDKKETEGGTGATYAQVVGPTSYQVPLGTTEAAALQAVKDGMTGYHTTDRNAATGEAYQDNELTWTMAENYNPNVAGKYTVTISYNGEDFGTATVEVVARTAKSVIPDKYEGIVERDSAADAATGAYLTVTWEDDTTEQVPVTLGMLSGSYNVKKNGTYSGLSFSYGGKNFENFTLKVVNKTGVDDYPLYPNPGSVDLKKSAAGVDFQNTGIARVELSASGLPASIGVDVIVMLDLSSSMNRCIAHDSKSCNVQGCKTRLAELKDAMQTFEDTLKASRNAENIRVAVADFNGMYTSSTSPYYAEDNDETADNPGLNNGEKDKVHTGTDGTLTASAFVSVEDLDVSAFNYSASTGTNYDYAFDAIYQLGHSIKKQNAANKEDRELFVLFMSDGAPNQYNYYRSVGGNNPNEGSANWNYWLQGTAEDEAHLQSLMNCNDHLYYYDWETGNQHRMANAVKGSPSTNYKVIRKSTTGLADVLGSTNQKNIYTIPGLGATMYAVAFDIANDGRIIAESVNHVLHNIPSSQDLYYEASEAGALQTAFNKIAGDIAYAATNARFVDQMGDSFNLQMNPTILTNNENSDGTRNTNTTIQITSHPVYTKEQVGTTVNGHLVTTNDIGKPYGNGTILETVSFTADQTGKISATTSVGGYKLPNGTTVTANSTNILVGDVIYGKNFFYNNNNAAVTVTLANGSAYSLPGETFYWNIGTINETLYTISYTVYLEGSLDGDKDTTPAPGSYDTNNFATLYYTNHVGNEVNKSVPSPSLAWEGANVSYAFYLVNTEGKPVHADGTAANNFLQAHKLTQPVVYQSVKLNDDEGATLSAAAVAVLPEGYKLYANDATYKVVVGSGDGEGANESHWEITGDVNETTYVVGYGGANDYSNAQNVNDTSYDYTHTTVYFAVVWTIGAVQDTVVIDYGLPVDINVMANDMFGSAGTLTAVGLRSKKPESKSQNLAAGFGATCEYGQNGASYGTATIKDGKIRYTPANMQMQGAEKLAYAVNYTGAANAGYYYGDLTVIPATTIYYEDEFVKLTTYKDKTYVEVTYAEDSNKTISYYEKVDNTYKIVTKPEIGKKYYITSYTSKNGWPKDSVAASGTQAEDRPGSINLSTIDANNIYGYDQAYDQMSTHSMNNSAMIHVDANQYGTAEFTFWGTGFDVISTTSNKTGTLVVQVYKENENNQELVKSHAVDTYYGYHYGLYKVTYEKIDNTWTLVGIADADQNATAQDMETIISSDPEATKVTGHQYVWRPVNNDPNALYQVPVMQYAGLPYAKYTVKISALYYSTFDATAEEGYDLYLDAIRIYDPAGAGEEVLSSKTDADGEVTNTTITDIYAQDGEAWPEYYELRDMIIEANTFKSLGENDEVAGIVFIDGNATLSKDSYITENAITDYTNFGPNNELYLASGQAVAFDMALGKNNTKPGYVPVVRIGLKTVGGKTAVAEMWNVIGSSATHYNAISDELKTATDMYYDITVLDNNTVVIKNSGESGSILSITNIKLTYKPTTLVEGEDDETNGQDQQSRMMFSVSRSTANAALMSLAPVQEEIPEESVPETTVPETTVPETTVPEETKPAKPDNSELKAAVEEAKKLKSKGYTQASFKNLKTAIKAAEKVLKDKKATQAQIDKALADLNAAVDGLETVAVKPIGPKPGGSGGKIKNNFKALDSITDVFRNLLKGNKK